MTELLIGKETRKYLSEIGLPISDFFHLPTSEKTFACGGNYGIEISSVNNLEILNKIIELTDEAGIIIDRIDECRGIMRLPDHEINEMVRICNDRNIGMIMSVGPRATYDIGAFSRSKNGSRSGYRLRGMENIVRAIEDIKRAIDLGVRGFLVYDEGLLYILNKLRGNGILPKECIFKVSVHCGPSNPASCLLYEINGANSINLIPDLELSAISAIRSTVQCPLDLFSDTANDAGGFIRTYDVPEFIRIASPIYLKCGPVSQKKQNYLPTEHELIERIKQTFLVINAIKKYFPEALQVNKSEKSIGIPEL